MYKGEEKQREEVKTRHKESKKYMEEEKIKGRNINKSQGIDEI